MKQLLFTLFIFLVGEVTAQQKLDIDKQLKLSIQLYKGMLTEFQDPLFFPQSVNPDGTYLKKKSDWWCSGFFGGILWQLYDYSKDDELKKGAQKWTVAVEKEQYNKGTHDLGFMLYCSYGNGYRLTQDEGYKKVLLNGAESLSTRFNPEVGVIKSWNTYKGYDYPVIIDNMMNLEFLFWASKATGNQKYYNICITHADKTIKEHFRPDNSSYHVVCYDSTGIVLAKMTAQGAADNSAWARGQAWGLYGFTVMYRETKDKKYLDQAIKIADFLVNHPSLAEDKIFYWDLNSPGIPNTERDASASAITASALLELAGYTNGELKNKYIEFAKEVLVSLSAPEYFASEGNNHFLLKHSTGNKPSGTEIDTPIIYADYYYIEALLRYNNL